MQPQKGDPAKTREHLRKLVLAPRDAGSLYALLLTGMQTAQGFSFDWAAGLEYLWDLARHGALAVTAAGGSHSPTSSTPFVIVTERGRRMLADGAASPYDASRYMQQLQATCPVGRALDPVTASYVREAIGALEASLFRASVVMLGCACERLIIMIADSIVAASFEGYATNLKKLRAPNKPPPGISLVFDHVRDAAGSAELPRQLSDASDRRLTAIFEHARGLRNRAGHPTGDVVSETDAETGLRLFPEFHRFGLSLIDAFASLAPTGGG